jgi:hypothetical protein
MGRTEEPALESDLNTPPNRLGGQDGADRHDHGHPAVPDCDDLARLGEIVDGREVVLVLHRRDYDQSGGDSEHDLPEPYGQRSIGVELRQHRQRKPSV